MQCIQITVYLIQMQIHLIYLTQSLICFITLLHMPDINPDDERQEWVFFLVHASLAVKLTSPCLFPELSLH